MPFSPAATEAERTLRLLSVIAAGVFILEIACFSATSSIFERGADYAVLATSLALICLLWLQVRAARRGRRIVQGEQHMVCAACGYILTGLPPSGRCPECSSAYRATSLRREWEEAYKPYGKVSAGRDAPMPPAGDAGDA